MEVLAIVPARGGSTGLADKNLRPLAGRPLVAWAVAAARRAATVDRVVVSTDDPRIAAAAAAAGAETIDRPAAIAGPEASSEAALLHALEALEEADGYRPDVVAFLQCTAPLTLAADVDGTVRRLAESGADTAIAVVPFHGFLWRGEAADGGDLAAVDHDAGHRPRRQDRPARWLEAGSVYALRAEGFRAAGHRFFGRTVGYPVAAGRRLEIDDARDLEVAERLIGLRLAAEAGAALPARVRAVVFDFDGVFTDGRVFVLSNGSEGVACDRRDGHGVERLRQAGVEMLVLSAERNPVVAARARKLSLPVLHGVTDKRPALDAWLAERGIAWSETVYLGDDLYDLPCLEAAGCGVAVADAVPAVAEAADLVLTRPGGRGAVRELCDLVLAARGPREGAA